jgi:anti-anti-sigma factor
VTQAQIWKGTPFSIERKEGKAPGTVIFRLCGPFTARDMFGSLTPAALHNMLDFQSTPSEQPPALNILDLTDVPYIDSTGLGMIVRHHVRCQGKGVRLIAAGVNPRVLDLFKLTKVETVFSMTATVEEADSH